VLQLLMAQKQRLILKSRPCFASFDLRSARSQNLFLAGLWITTMVIWLLSLGLRAGLCYSK
jgi:hypothetical protein